MIRRTHKSARNVGRRSALGEKGPPESGPGPRSAFGSALADHGDEHVAGRQRLGQFFAGHRGLAENDAVANRQGASSWMLTPVPFPCGQAAPIRVQ
jgi:hypothetical protein